MAEKSKGLFVIESGDAEQPYAYAAGSHGSKFLAELRDNKRIFGVRCPKCQKVYVPPRNVCGPCFEPMTEFVETGPEGKIELFTILRFSFLDPETGAKKPVPYGYGLIRLDRSNTNFQHFISVEGVEDKLKIGARVRAVFNPQREGSLRDILHFELIDKS